MEQGALEGAVKDLEALWGAKRFEEAGGAAWLALREMAEPPPDLAAWAAWHWREYVGKEAGEYRERGRRKRPLTGFDLDRLGGGASAKGGAE